MEASTMEIAEPQTGAGDHRTASTRRSPHQGPAERAARGKRARKEAPRSSHRDWEPAEDRPDPIEILERQATTRVPELVPIRYGRMLVSPLTFYRGSAAVMASDLATTPQSGLRVQLCGDAHLSNFGAFAAPRVDGELRTIKAQAEARQHFESYVRETAGGSPVDELSKLHDLKEKGAISDDEFARAKEKLLA